MGQDLQYHPSVAQNVKGRWSEDSIIHNQRFPLSILQSFERGFWHGAKTQRALIKTLP